MNNTRTNEEWLRDLRASGAIQEAAIVDLRNLLLRTVLFFFNRNVGDFSKLAHTEILQLAEDCAQEALLAVLNHLADFRGDSRFTTWAYKFAVNIALITARRQRWKDISLDQLTFARDGFYSEWVMMEKSGVPTPDQSAVQAEIRDIIQDVIEHELTDKQRHVLFMMVFHEIPMDKVVQLIDMNRNAIYKVLHDARRKIKSRLQARGFEVSEMLALFSSPR